MYSYSIAIFTAIQPTEAFIPRRTRPRVFFPRKFQSHKLIMLLLTFLNTKRGVVWWARACWPSLVKKSGRRSAAQQSREQCSVCRESGSKLLSEEQAHAYLCSHRALSFLFSSGHVEPRSIGRTCLLKRVFVNTVIFTAVSFHSVDDFSFILYLAEKQLKALDNGTFQDPPTSCQPQSFSGCRRTVLSNNLVSCKYFHTISAKKASQWSN